MHEDWDEYVAQLMKISENHVHVVFVAAASRIARVSFRQLSASRANALWHLLPESSNPWRGEVTLHDRHTLRTVEFHVRSSDTAEFKALVLRLEELVRVHEHLLK
jgi:hypothetical protein